MKKNLLRNMAVILIMLCFAIGIAVSVSGKAFAQASVMKDTDQKIEKLEKELKELKEAKEEKEQIEEKTEEKLNKKLEEIDKKIKKKEITSDVEEEEQNYREYSDGSVKIGETVNIAEDEVVNDDVVFIGCKVKLDGKINGDTVFIACKVDMGAKSEITGDAVLLLGKLHKEPGAKITGDIVNITPFNLFWSPDFHPNYHYEKEPASDKHYKALWDIVVKLIFFLILILLFPKKIQQISEKIELEAGKCFLYGLLGTILIIPVALLLLVSIIGIPFIAAEILLIIAAVIMGYAGVALLLGRKIKTETKVLMGASLLVQALIGVLIIELLKLIPIIGMLLILLVYTFGFGAALMVFFRSTKKPAMPAPVAVVPAPQNAIEPPKE